MNGGTKGGNERERGWEKGRNGRREEREGGKEEGRKGGERKGERGGREKEGAETHTQSKKATTYS